MSKKEDIPWIPDENGEKIIIPKELYSEIRRRIKDLPKIKYNKVCQKDIDHFFQKKINFSTKDKSY